MVQQTAHKTDELLLKKREEVRQKPQNLDGDQVIPLPETVALVLQGGGALGSYQAGVYEALVEQDIRIDWIAGISIGAINSAIIAGNPFKTAWERLREFWEHITSGSPNMVFADTAYWRKLNHGMGAFTSATVGVPGFYTPHMVHPNFALPGTPNALSIYDTSPLIETLNRFVDWDRLNDGPMRFSVGAVDIESGNFEYFDTRDPDKPTRIDARHVLASGALPPGFPPVEIDGRYYWDGGIVSNTPLAHVLENQSDDMLIFQVDLFPAKGKLPQDFGDVMSRVKDIRYSSRTRAVTDNYLRIRSEHEAIRSVLSKLPPEASDDEDVQKVRALINDNAVNIVHLICKVDEWESGARDFEFSRPTMERHWAQGIDAVLSVVKNRELLTRNILDGKTAAFDL